MKAEMGFFRALVICEAPEWVALVALPQDEKDECERRGFVVRDRSFTLRVPVPLVPPAWLRVEADLGYRFSCDGGCRKRGLSD